MNTQAKPCTDNGQSILDRPRFFPRQLVTPDDLTLGQDYLRNKLRRLTRHLHGWGVVCGARVVFPKKKPLPQWKVVIEKGYILGPYGDEIVIPQAICFDLRTRCLNASCGDPCEETQDPCAEEQVADKRRDGVWYVAVRYKELPARPVRVQPAGCGCEESRCEYTRWRDGYEICVLEKSPDSQANPPDLKKLLEPGTIPDCPDCPDNPWVVLASVKLDAGQVVEIDNHSYRRMVLSLAPYWWKCTDAILTPPSQDA